MQKYSSSIGRGIEMEDLTRTQFIQLTPEYLGESASVKDVIASVRGSDIYHQPQGRESHDHEGGAGRACGGDVKVLHLQCGLE